jgi:hypothetical protein
MTKRKPRDHELEQVELSIRDQVGLTSASEGNTKGAHIFTRFVERELLSVAYFGGLPEPIAIRLQCLMQEARQVSHFIDGWNANDESKAKARKA